MLKYMTLIRGNAEITYPIYQISDLTKMGFSVSGTSSDSIKFVAYNCSPTATPDGVQSVFADEIPTTPSDYGNITQNAMRFVLDTATRKQYCPSAHFVAVPIGEKPDDWDTNYFDYFVYQTGQVGNWGNVPVAVYPTTNPREIPAWSNTLQYYKMNTETPQERINHLFFTKAGYSFGVWSMSGQGEGEGAYMHASFIACNPRFTGAPDDAYAYIWRDRNGNPMNHSAVSTAGFFAYWRTNCMDIIPPASGQQIIYTPLTSDRRDMQIFCYCEYDGTMYYGVMAIAIDSNGKLTNARSLMFTADFWGESITDDTPEQGGDWGDETARRGGDGTFYAPSNNFDDRNGTQLAANIAAANTALKNALLGAFPAYYVREFQFPDVLGDLPPIIGVLYGSDYFDRFRNSMYNPLSAIVSCAMFPARFIHLIDGLHDMTAGGFNITQHMSLTQIQFREAEPLIFEHIGDIDITKYFGAFPDFAPYTTAKLYLPYCGEIDIDINKIMYGVLSVSYAVDILSGNCTAYIWADDANGNHNYIASVSGNCAYNLPLFAATSDGAAMGKMVSGITSAMMGNIAGAGASLISGALSMPSRQTQISGTFSGNIGMTGRTKVLLQISRPQWVNPANYQNQSGIPSEISGKLSDFRGGFVQVETIDLQNVPATETELAEIESLLESGIYYVSN